MKNIERRTATVELRDLDTSSGSGAIGVMVGRIPYDSPSEDLGGFTEVLKPGAFDRTLRDNPDVRALWNHETGDLLGRTKSGTLRLSTDATALTFELDLPNTSVGRDVAEMAKRGDLSGASFGMVVQAQEWRKTPTGIVRDVLDLDLLEISPCSFPAYESTEVAMRSLAEHLAGERFDADWMAMILRIKAHR